MTICPHCGAENPEGADFCSLCLARFSPGAQEAQPPYRPTGQVPQAALGTGAAQTPVTPPEQPYVSPGDYHALAREMSQGAVEQVPAYRDTAYYRAAMSEPGKIASAGVPAVARQRTAGQMAAMVLWHSLLAFFVLIAVRWASQLLGGAIAGRSLLEGSEAGAWIGILIIVLAELAVIVWAGYWISSRARERGRGWVYGLACVAAMVFVWQALLMLIFELAGFKVLVSMFNLVFILIIVFLYLPMGALGGWMAEKRYVG